MNNRFANAVRRLGCMVVATFGLAGSASATLLDRGPDLVYDVVLNITWTRNANLPGSTGLTWDQANTWAANLVFAGFDDWRLPRASRGTSDVPVACSEVSELACRNNEMGYMFYHDLAGKHGIDKQGTQTARGGEVVTGIQFDYWSGTDFLPDNAWLFRFAIGQVVGAGENNPAAAWAVRDGDVRATIPEPSSVLLIGAGMVGLMVRMRRRALS